MLDLLKFLSQCHLTEATRLHCKGYMKLCSLPNTIGHLLLSFVLSSSGQKTDDTDHYTNYTRWLRNFIGCHHDVLTKGMNTRQRWHKNEASHLLLGILWHDKDLPADHELEAVASENEPVFLKGLQMPSRMPQSLYTYLLTNCIGQVAPLWPNK